MSQKRQLAAIMFTDIVGYTALMGKDSVKTLELIHISKEIQKPLVEKHNGKWLKEMGDGAMAQFSTALDAVNCSIEIQEIARGKLDAKLRIGIHLGDITIENEDIYGDGVNIASRLESIADAGGIYISESIEKAIQGQTDVQAKYLGEVKLKNVAYGVKTYALQAVGLPVPEVKDEKELSGHFIAELQRRGVLRAGTVYLGVALILILLLREGQNWLTVPDWSIVALMTMLIIGLPIALYLAWNYERSPEGFVRTSSRESWQNPYTAGQRKPLTSNFIIAVMALIIIVMYVYPRYISSEAGTEVNVHDKSIAVLPFKSLSDDREKQYLADGVMDAILLHLSKIEDLRVITRTSVEKYRDPTQTIIEIARELKVNYILEGSFQKYGDQVRLIVQLSNAEEKEDHIWANEYNRDWSDIFSVQSEVAQTIATELHAVITPEVKERIETVPTSDLTAYDFYLKGEEYHLRSRMEENWRYAIQMFKRAVEIDLNYTLAWVGLASVSRSIYWFHYDRSEEHLEQTKQYLDKAIALDPDQMEVQLETGMYYYHCKLNYPKALQILEKLKSEYPKNHSLHLMVGYVYRRMGQFEKAFEYIDQGISLNRSGWMGWNDAGVTLIMLGRYDQAEDYLKTAIDLNPSETEASPTQAKV